MGEASARGVQDAPAPSDRPRRGGEADPPTRRRREARPAWLAALALASAGGCGEASDIDWPEVEALAAEASASPTGVACEPALDAEGEAAARPDQALAALGIEPERCATASALASRPGLVPPILEDAVRLGPDAPICCLWGTGPGTMLLAVGARREGIVSNEDEGPPEDDDDEPPEDDDTSGQAPEIAGAIDLSTCVMVLPQGWPAWAVRGSR